MGDPLLEAGAKSRLRQNQRADARPRAETGQHWPMSDRKGQCMAADPSRYLRALLVANDATQAMQAAVERTRQALDCDVSWTGLVEDDCLHMGASSGLRSPEMTAAWRLEVGAGIGGRAALLGRPHKSNDYQHDARRVAAKRLIDNEGIVTVLVVP